MVLILLSLKMRKKNKNNYVKDVNKMKNKKITFEQGLNELIKKVEKYLTAEEKENLYQQALKLSNEDKSLSVLKIQVEKIEKIYEDFASEYNERINNFNDETEAFDKMISEIEQRIFLEKYTDTIKPIKLDITKDDMKKLNTDDLTKVFENIIGELFKK